MLTKEKIEHHIDHLKEQHAEIDKKLKEQIDHYGNQSKIVELKKQKLELKDQIQLMKVKINEVTR